MPKFNKTNYIIVALIIIVIALCWKSCNGNLNLKEQIGLYEAIQDTLTTTRNNLGQQKTKIGLLIADRGNTFLKIQTNDSTIIALQKVVKDYKGKLLSATVLSNNTSDQGSTKTQISKFDTIKTDTGLVSFPVYDTDWDEKWSKGIIIASVDSIKRDIKVKNEYKITQGFEKQGFLKKRKPVISILNLNPNTVTTELRNFTVQPHKNKVSIGVGFTYGLNIMTLAPAIVVGPTINMPIISW